MDTQLTNGTLPIEREGIRVENPEQYYNWGAEIGWGKFSVVRQAIKKETGEIFAAKMIKYDEDSIKFAVREYDIMASGKLADPHTVKLHEAYLVRDYLILIMALAQGDTMLEAVSSWGTVTEDDIATQIRQLVGTLATLHGNNVVHLDIRPTNIRIDSDRNLKLVDYNSARVIANKKAGAVVDVIGDTEFCAPEMLNFDPVVPGTDMWSVGVITYTLLSGISPFYYEDEDQVIETVQRVKWRFDETAFAGVTAEAKDFIKKVFIRAPEMRMTASNALEHPWLSDANKAKRKAVVISSEVLDRMSETAARLFSEEEEEYIEASFVFRTFDEELFDPTDEPTDFLGLKELAFARVRSKLVWGPEGEETKRIALKALSLFSDAPGLEDKIQVLDTLSSYHELRNEREESYRWFDEYEELYMEYEEIERRK